MVDVERFRMLLEAERLRKLALLPALQRDITIPETVDAWAASAFSVDVEDDQTLAIRRA